MDGKRCEIKKHTMRRDSEMERKSTWNVEEGEE